MNAFDPDYKTLELRPLTPQTGAEVDGVDLSADLGEQQLAEVRRAFLDRHVLVFRNQQISRDQHKAFGRKFGSLHVHPAKKTLGLGGDPEIFDVKANEKTKFANGALWHADLTCEEVPPLGSMLLMKQLPDVGGDTLFANMHLAFESLSAPIKDMLRKLTAVHDGLQDLQNYGIRPSADIDYPRNEHPVVVRHPETGRELLFVNSAFTSHIKGMSRRESDGLLRLLCDHIASDPRLHCRVRWAKDTLVFWDNRSCQHFAVGDYHPAVRVAERVSIQDTVRPSQRTTRPG